MFETCGLEIPYRFDMAVKVCPSRHSLRMAMMSSLVNVDIGCDSPMTMLRVLGVPGIGPGLGCS